MKASELSALVWEMAKPIAEKNGCSVWDVKFVREGGEYVLKVTLDSEKGVDMDMCESVNRELGDKLDQADPIEQSYCLEVSSAGLCRELKRDSDFDRFIGSKADVKLKKPSDDGKKSFTAVIEARNGDEISFSGGLSFKKSEINSCRLHVDF